MSFSFGVYEVFANVVPGGLQLAVAMYVLDRLQWVEAESILGASTTTQLVVGFGGSLLVGHLIYPAALRISRPKNHQTSDSVRETFRAENPEHADRRYLDLHFSTLLSAIVFHAPELEPRIDRLAATGLMLRNSVIPFLALRI